MKELYEELELEVIRFKTEDIITTSDAATDQNQGQSQDQNDQEQNEGGITYTQIGDTTQYMGSDGEVYFLIDGKYVPADPES